MRKPGVGHGLLVTGLVLAVIHWGGVVSAEEKEAQGLSPRGQALLEEKTKDWPAFDEAAVRREAEEQFPDVKEGQQVTVSVRGRDITGAFRGINAKYLRLGDRNVALIDLDPDTIARFSPDGMRKLREQHLAVARRDYEADRRRRMTELQEALAMQFPAPPAAMMKTLFAKLPEDRREAITQEFLSLYDSRLPLIGPQPPVLAAATEALLAAHPELTRDGENLWVAAQLEELRRHRAEILAAREERLRTRILRPRTAAPIFRPDGSDFRPGVKLAIASPTPGAEIHYTFDGSDPDEDSPRYTQPLSLREKAIVRAIAYHPEFNDSETTTVAPWERPWVPGGLFASYFSKVTFKGRTGTRVDPTVNFSWGDKPCYPGLPTDYISAMWTGRIRPPRTGEYTFHIWGDNSFRFWLDGKLLMNFWAEAVQSRTATVSLVGGRTYEVKICLTESWGVMGIKWEWEGPGISRQIVPAEVLCPNGRYTDELRRWNIRANRRTMTNPAAVNGDYRMPCPPGTNQGQKRVINWAELDNDDD